MSKWKGNEWPLYFVTDGKLTKGRDLVSVIEASLQGGIRLIQLRHKELDDEAFFNLGQKVLPICRAFGATLLIDDRVDLCARLNADGVHLGQGDMHPIEARKRLGPEAIIGWSTHNQKEIEMSKGLPLSYVNIGPIFPTQTKDTSAYGNLGLEKVLALSKVSNFPVTIMGGIKRSHFKQLFLNGLKTLAVVTEISMADSIQAHVKELLNEIQQIKSELN